MESPVTTAETVSDAGVAPLDGETRSHETLPALAVNVALGLALSDNVCDAGDVPPAVAENDNEVGLTVSVFIVAEIFNCTGTLLV